MPSIQQFLNLIRSFRSRLDSAQAYQNFQALQGNLLIDYLRNFGVGIQNQSILDLGYGLGGYSNSFAIQGGNVIGVDLEPYNRDVNATLIQADSVSIPLENNSISTIICASLIEHIPYPESLLEETFRIVKEGGFVYISFPPFYSLKGGHQFSPFHLLGEKAAIKIKKKVGLYRNRPWLQKKYSEKPESFSEAYGSWGIYKMTIGYFENLLKKTNFNIINRSTRWIPVDFSGIPILREFLTWHVQYLLSKPLHDATSTSEL